MEPVLLRSRFVLDTLAMHHGRALAAYFDGLSAVSRRFFQPHALTAQAAEQVCREVRHATVLRCILQYQDRIVGYFVLDPEPAEADSARYLAQGIRLRARQDFAFAASVAEAQQGSGLASSAMPHLLRAVVDRGARSLVLMGGVQDTNAPALAFFRKWGFVSHAGYRTHTFQHDMRLVVDADACREEAPVARPPLQ